MTAAVRHRASQTYKPWVCALIGLIASCASQPEIAPAPVVAPVTAVLPEPKQARLVRLLATLKQLGFEQQDETLRLTLPQPIVFPFDSDQVADGARISIGRVGRELAALKVDRVFVYGHTDNLGPAQYNQALSLRRAEVVAQILIDNGVPVDRVTRSGLGATVSVASNATTAGRAQNRRVVIVVQVD
jgi:outer membrane protein OmpA-like peptidoglycan-associated protein